MKVIITGATGMVGKAVLLECLASDKITEVLLINRRPVDTQHDKIKEIILKDFMQLATVKNQLSDYDGCFFCMGVSAIGMSEEKYTAITFDVTKVFADILHELNPNMVFNYVSGTRTDSTEKGRSMWARVKGKTENYILNKGFKDAYAFRPGVILPEKGIKSNTGWYNSAYVVLRPFFGIMKKSKHITTTTVLGQAMINSLTINQKLKHLENVDINEMGSFSC